MQEIERGDDTVDARRSGQPGTLRLAYVVPIYPMISQTFIRREVAALEGLGMAIQMYSLRGSMEELVDPLDVAARERTRVVLGVGILGLVRATLSSALSRPSRFLRATLLALQLGLRSHRGVLLHMIYLAEACVLRRWFEEAEIDHVHAHFGTNAAAAALFCRTLGGPTYSLTIHGACDIDHASTEGLDAKIGGAAFAVSICAYLRSQLYRCVSYEHWSKIRVVHCGLAADFLKARATPFPSARRLIFVGRLSEEKALPTLIMAADRLRAGGQSFELILVGDGPSRPQIEKLIEEYGLAGCVRLTGWQTSTQIRELISSSRALVLPSYMEGVPTVIMEAMALHRPVIGTYVGGIPELVVPGVNGWLVPASCVDELAAAMSAALEASIEDLERMGGAGAERVDREYNVLNAAALLAELFLDATKHREINSQAEFIANDGKRLQATRRLQSAT